MVYLFPSFSFQAIYTFGSKVVVPNLFGTRDWFRGRQFFHRPGGGGPEMVQEVMQAMVQAVTQVIVQAVIQAMGTDGERQIKLCLLACCSPPAVRPGS